jgi:hypothetical protein
VQANAAEITTAGTALNGCIFILVDFLAITVRAGLPFAGCPARRGSDAL